MAQVFDVVGKSTPKRDGLDKVTGRTRYLHDLELPRLVHGKILRTRLPHARIVRLDTKRARALPGVLAVLTAEDVEQRPFGFAKDQLALKRGKVRCIRDEVAAVVAETPELAEEALALIDVEYEELPAVFDPLKALEPGAPLVHEELTTNRHHLRYQFTHGDVDRALAEAAVVVEDTYRLNFVTPACMGTMVALADWDHAGNLTMWTTTQVPFLYQRDLGDALGVGGARVRVLQPPVGGNFGRGLDVYPIDVIAALLARAAREQRGDHVDRIEIEAPPEVAAHRGLEHAHAVTADAERVSEIALIEERYLRRAPHRQPAFGIPLGDGDHRAQARRRDEVQPVFTLDDHGRFAERAIDVTVAELIAQRRDVRAETLVNERGAGRQRGGR